MLSAAPYFALPSSCIALDNSNIPGGGRYTACRHSDAFSKRSINHHRRQHPDAFCTSSRVLKFELTTHDLMSHCNPLDFQCLFPVRHVSMAIATRSPEGFTTLPLQRQAASRRGSRYSQRCNR